MQRYVNRWQYHMLIASASGDHTEQILWIFKSHPCWFCWNMRFFNVVLCWTLTHTQRRKNLIGKRLKLILIFKSMNNFLINLESLLTHLRNKEMKTLPSFYTSNQTSWVWKWWHLKNFGLPETKEKQNIILLFMLIITIQELKYPIQVWSTFGAVKKPMTSDILRTLIQSVNLFRSLRSVRSLKCVTSPRSINNISLINKWMVSKMKWNNLIWQYFMLPL